MSSSPAPAAQLSDPFDADTWQALTERSQRVASAERRRMLPVLAGLALFAATMFSGIVAPSISMEERSGSGEMTSPSHWRYTLVESVRNNGWMPLTISGPASTNVPGVRIIDAQTAGRIPGFGRRDVSFVMDISDCNATRRPSGVTTFWLHLTAHTVLGERTISMPAPMGLVDAEDMGCH